MIATVWIKSGRTIGAAHALSRDVLTRALGMLEGVPSNLALAGRTRSVDAVSMVGLLNCTQRQYQLVSWSATGRVDFVGALGSRRGSWPSRA